MAERETGGEALELHPKVAIRPEPFGALAYHYDTRRLVFLRSIRLVAVVESLAEHETVDAALAAAGVGPPDRARYLEALTSLISSGFLVPRRSAPTDLTARVQTPAH